MRIFNADKTQELAKNSDFSGGKLVKDKLFVAHHAEVPAVAAKTAAEVAAELVQQGKTVEEYGGVPYEIVQVYPNGGKDAKEVSAVPAAPAKAAWDEYEDILVYTPYTEAELAALAAKNAIADAKAYLNKTDYIVLKIAEATAEGDAEGVAALQEEYAEQLAKRKEARAAVNEMEATVREASA